MKKFFAEFKAFISRGNIIDLAIGVIIGGAFSAIVTALTNNILMPIINWILLAITGGEGLDQIFTYLKKVYEVGEDGTVLTTIDLTKSIYIDWGAFITAIINFILIALVLFLIVKLINDTRKNVEENKNKFAPLTKDEVKALKKEGKNKEEILAVAAQRKAEKEEADKKAAEEAAAAEANAVTTEKLLAEIRDLLKEQKAPKE